MRRLVYAGAYRGRLVYATAYTAGLLALAACTSGGSSRECSFARPLIFSHKSIAGLEDVDARSLLSYNRTVQAVCR